MVPMGYFECATVGKNDSKWTERLRVADLFYVLGSHERAAH
jgi:hypothetical protein